MLDEIAAGTVLEDWKRVGGRMALTETHDYDDIINLPHHQSRRHAHMALSGRAAQFMPFAALTGYEDVLNRTVRANEEAIAKANTPVDVADGYLPA